MIERVRRIGWMVAAALTMLGISAPAAGAAGFKVSAPLGQYASILTFTVTEITPALATATGPATVRITGTMTNTAQETLTSVVGRVQRGDPLESPTAVQAELSNPGQPATRWTVFGSLVDAIEPGATVPFTIEAPLFGVERESLAVTDPGVYPIMVNVNAEFASAPVGGARVGELHALLTVTSVPQPAEPSAGDPVVEPAGSSVIPVGQPMNLLLPLVDRPHRDATGAFFDDDLAPLISAGGRLDAVLRAAEDSALPAGAITLAVDPELLEELQLMSAGYYVGPFDFDITRGSGGTTATSSAIQNPPATGAETPAGATSAPPTSSDVAPTDTPEGSGTADYVPVPAASAVPGTGADAAAVFLRRIQLISVQVPTLVLPYSDIDAVAAVRAGHGDQLTAAISHGQQIAVEILGAKAQLVTDVSWPIDGFSDDPTLAVLRAAGLRTSVLDRTAFSTVGSADAALSSAAADIPTRAGEVTAVLASSAVPTGALGLNTFTAITAQNYFSGANAPAVYAAGRDWRPDAASYPEMTALLGQLGAAGIVVGSRISDLGSTTGLIGGRLSYPAAAADRELPASVFSQIQELTSELSSIQDAFNPNDGELAAGDVSTFAPPGLFADLIDGFSRQAAGGFRSNPTAGGESADAVQSIIESIQSKVWINPPTASYTLTSSSSPILVTIRNDMPYTAHLRVRVNPDDALRAGIRVQDIGVQTIPAGRSVNIRIPAEVTRAGSLTLRVQLTNPDGALWGTEQTLSMKSTAYGTFTVAIIVVAAVIVVLTAAGRIRKRFKQRNQQADTS